MSPPHNLSPEEAFAFRRWNHTTVATEAKTKAWSFPNMSVFLPTNDGQKIYATERGEGSIAVVVVHGFTGGHRHGSHARLLGWFQKTLRVIAIDQRGHGKSSGYCTLSHYEVLDVDAAVKWARELGAQKVVTVGFSLGASSVLRHAALSNTSQRTEYDEGLVVEQKPDAVVIIGGVAQWWFRGSRKMRFLHALVKFSIGQAFLRRYSEVRVGPNTWPDEHAPNRHEIQPLDPLDSATALAPIPLLIISGSEDDYFPNDHGHRLFEAATKNHDNNAEFWYEQGMGHAEAATTPELVDRISAWIQQRVN
jgi:pimeloyl-ACP methyl ester carboxylesterase